MQSNTSSASFIFPTAVELHASLQYQWSIKCTIAGDPCVGKTELLLCRERIEQQRQKEKELLSPHEGSEDAPRIPRDGGGHVPHAIGIRPMMKKLVSSHTPSAVDAVPADTLKLPLGASAFQRSRPALHVFRCLEVIKTNPSCSMFPTFSSAGTLEHRQHSFGYPSTLFSAASSPWMKQSSSLAMDRIPLDPSSKVRTSMTFAENTTKKEEEHVDPFNHAWNVGKGVAGRKPGTADPCAVISSVGKSVEYSPPSPLPVDAIRWGDEVGAAALERRGRREKGEDPREAHSASSAEHHAHFVRLDPHASDCVNGTEEAYDGWEGRRSERTETVEKVGEESNRESPLGHPARMITATEKKQQKGKKKQKAMDGEAAQVKSNIVEPTITTIPMPGKRMKSSKKKDKQSSPHRANLQHGILDPMLHHRSATEASLGAEEMTVKLCLWDSLTMPAPYRFLSSVRSHDSPTTGSYSSTAFPSPSVLANFASSAVILLVCSAVDRRSYMNVGEWLHSCRSFAPPSAVIALVLNKVDLLPEMQPSPSRSLLPPPYFMAFKKKMEENEGVHRAEGEDPHPASSHTNGHTTSHAGEVEVHTVSIEEASTFARAQHLLFFPCSAQTGEGVETLFQEITREVWRRVSLKEMEVEEEADPKSGSPFPLPLGKCSGVQLHPLFRTAPKSSGLHGSKESAVCCAWFW